MKALVCSCPRAQAAHLTQLLFGLPSVYRPNETVLLCRLASISGRSQRHLRCVFVFECEHVVERAACKQLTGKRKEISTWMWMLTEIGIGIWIEPT